jgi:hypothetical protein
MDQQAQRNGEVGAKSVSDHGSSGTRRQDGVQTNTVARNPGADAAPAVAPSQINGTYKISR